ncbi:hypothetical protein KP509_24G055900 [Ceratopteris richardii]|uniref:Secreted protein n=1 Tax=Ceratopteris richardii TaxID=49495 RepID=A0A8T2RV92_CERRI|nr:hypothetical protein KP509_24G055900 [Ceratopteris richardii]
MSSPPLSLLLRLLPSMLHHLVIHELWQRNKHGPCPSLSSLTQKKTHTQTQKSSKAAQIHIMLPDCHCLGRRQHQRCCLSFSLLLKHCCTPRC